MASKWSYKRDIQFLMASQWCYKREVLSRIGPFTAKKLKEMASSGQILPIHAVRREGPEMMVEARRVEGLFPRLA